MQLHRFTLDKSSAKHVCPSCGKRRFVRYIDTTTGKYLPDRFGRCDREAECSHHNKPYQQKAPGDWQRSSAMARPEQRATAYIPDEILNGTLRHYGHNTFVRNLTERIAHPFDRHHVENICKLYKIGTICDGYMAGATTFPYIDIDGATRAIQVRMYDKNNHGTKTTFIHSLLKSHFDKLGKGLPGWLTEYLKCEAVVSCLFGEHLLRAYPDRPVNIVEAPKTAIIATLYFGHPDSNPNVPIWLASFNLSALNFARCKVIRGRRVTLFPDLSKNGRTYRLWKAKALDLAEMIPSSRWTVSKLIEDSAAPDERAKGADLADFLIRLDWRNFTSIEHCEAVDTEAAAFAELMDYFEARRVEFQAEALGTTPPMDARGSALPMTDKLASEQGTDAAELRELEVYFQSCTYPNEPLMIDGFSVTDCEKFARAQISFLRASARQVYRLPYLQRLRRLRSILEAYGAQAKAV